MPGGVGGEEPRGSPLSRSIRFTSALDSSRLRAYHYESPPVVQSQGRTSQVMLPIRRNYPGTVVADINTPESWMSLKSLPSPHDSWGYSVIPIGRAIVPVCSG